MAGGYTKVRKWNPKTKRYETQWLKASAAAKLPKFKKVNGKWVRQGAAAKPATSTAATGNKPAQEWADAAIQQKLEPLNEEAHAARVNADHQTATSATATAATTAELSKLQGEAAGFTGSQLVNVAESAAAAQGGHDKNLDFLREVFGGSYADDVNVGQHTADSAKAQDAGVAAQLGMGAQAQQQELGTYRAASTARHGDFRRQAEVARDRALEDVRRRSTGVQQEKPLLERMYANEDRDYQLKKWALDLDREGMRVSDANADADRTAAANQQATAIAAEAAAAAAEPVKPGDKPPTARAKTLAAVGTLSDSIAKAQAALASGEPTGVALAALRTNGLVANRDYEVDGKKVKLLPAGAVRYFQNLAGMAPNHAYYAIKLYNPALAARFQLKNVNGKWKLLPARERHTGNPHPGHNSIL